MKIDLSGKTALVTGAAGELGRVIALTLAECGADIAVHYHKNKEGAEKVRERVHKLGRRVCIVQADIGESESVNSMKEAIERELGAPEIIINNAVSQYQWKHILEQDVRDYEDQFRTSVLQNVLMAKAFVPEMIKKKYGRVIAINTECAMQNFPNQSAYVAGKRGMDGVLRVLAKEVGEHGITVNQVAPGWTISDKDRAAHSERQPEYEKIVPLRRRGSDQDIANAVAFLASDLAAFISGVYLPVSGGSVMPGI